MSDIQGRIEAAKESRNLKLQFFVQSCQPLIDHINKLADENLPNGVTLRFTVTERQGRGNRSYTYFDIWFEKNGEELEEKFELSQIDGEGLVVTKGKKYLSKKIKGLLNLSEKGDVLRITSGIDNWFVDQVANQFKNGRARPKIGFMRTITREI